MVTVFVYDVRELCQAIHISEHCLVEIVEHGIVEPEGDSIAEWVFDTHALALVGKAVRLQRDLELDWTATALAINLLEKIDQLHTDNEYLKQRLKRLELTQIKLL